MSDETVVRQCAPTLAGIKSGNLFPCDYDSREELEKEIRAFNRSYVRRGLCLLPLRFGEKRALLYLFRPEGLKKDLQNSLAQSLLCRAGYPAGNCSACVSCLVKRFRESGNFPHEIGLFLGYPPEDVQGFIENHADNYKRIGMWKVYGDEEKAQRLFDRFQRCTDSYCRCLRQGMGLDQLAVAV